VKPFDLSKLRKDLTKSIDGISFGFNDPTDWIDTGNYALNYLISGDFHRGVPLGKVTMFAGESGAGKSFICSANLIRDAQRQGIFVVLIDTENALDESWLTALGVSTAEDKLLKVSLSMIDDVAKLISMFMKDYKDQPAEKRVKTLFVIDSLGMLLTPTDINQFESGDMKGDMGRKPKALAALVRNCVNMFGNYNVGMVCTNHTYGSQDPYNPDDKISGGCLVAGTNVTMADGSYKPIEKLELDDMVQTMFGAQPVTNLWHYQKTTVSLTLEDGSTIECSPEHKFLVNRFEGQLWVSANDLTEEDEILAV